ncbi:MAG: fluoride efflux transporter CrcB [Acidiferrobacterales bacterium]
MTQMLAIAAGGAVGALMRYWVSIGVYALVGRSFPYGTLVVNVMGSLAMGLLFVLLIERMDVASIWRAALLVGLLGAFTTFSTFSIETLNLVEEGAYAQALMNVVLSVVLCIAAAWVGVKLGRQL